MRNIVHQLRCWFAESLFYAAYYCMPEGSIEQFEMAKAVFYYTSAMKARL